MARFPEKIIFTVTENPRFRMQKAPEISILMPVKNVAPWIQETIGSILNQSLKDWELIVIDDHSTDETVELIGKFEDPRIQIATNFGEGIIPALQTGLALTKGTFITRMDGDDLMPEHKLELLHALCSVSNERIIATGKVRYFSDKEISEGYKKYASWLNDRIDNNDHFQHIYRECVIASPNWMVRKELLEQDRIFERLKYPEDYDMTFRWLEKGYQVRSTELITHLWREHPSRTSRNSDIYAQKSFFKLKLQWFLKLHPEIKRIAVFGADSKGKLVIDALQHAIELRWYDLNFRKFRAPISGFPIQNPDDCLESFALIAVYPENLKALESYLQTKGFEVGINAWYV